MTTLENLKAYVEYQIRDMRSSTEWAMNKMADETRDFRLEWALDQIDQAEAKADGVVSFASIWDDGNKNDQNFKDECDKLRTMIRDAWFKEREYALDNI